jgi:hypothetical protein
MENNKPAMLNTEIKFIGTKNNYALFEIGSGNYSFTSTMK